MKSEKELKLDFSSWKKLIGAVLKMLALYLMLCKYFVIDLAQKCQCDNEIY